MASCKETSEGSNESHCQYGRLLIFVILSALVWILCGVIGVGSSDCDTILNAWRSGDDAGISHSLAGTDAFTSASIAEIVRAGVESVRPGQWAAAAALGLKSGEAVSYVIFPQAMRLIMPPPRQSVHDAYQNSSLAVMVGYPDLVNVGTTVMNVTGQALEVICIIMGVYLTVNIIIAFIMNHFNARIMRAPQ